MYMRDILLTNPLFSQLDDNDLDEITNKTSSIEKPKDSTLFTNGEIAQNIFVVIQGIVNEEYDQTQKETVNLGTIIGINALVDEDSKYDTTVVCESRCTLIAVPLHHMQKFINNYSDFENTVYEIYFLHKIHFSTEYPRLIEVI